MEKTKVLEIKCTNLACGAWFPSPIFFGNLESFDSSVMIGNKAQCPVCKKMTGCNKENMRIVSDKGGFRGNDTF